jgi:hypothetical protein
MNMRIPIRPFTKSHLSFTLFAALLLLPASLAAAQNTDNDDDKNVDIQLHAGKDADARKIGLPLYPGARLKHGEENQNQANFALLTGAFGMKLVVANYDSADSPSKVIAYYREQLKRYGRVLECRTKESGGDVHANLHNQDSKDSKQLKCDGDNTGNIVELKVGTEDNQHVVSVEPSETGKGSTFALVYVYTRGKQADI